MPKAQSLRYACAFLLTALLPVTDVLADPKPEVPTDPWEVIHIARESGEASVAHDPLRDPMILAESEGVSYEIGFYGCYLGRDCETLLFRAKLLNEAWQGEHPEVEIIDDWNAGKLFGRAILAESGHAILEHPVAMGPGMSQSNRPGSP